MSPTYQRTFTPDLEGVRELHRDLVRLFDERSVSAKARHDAQLVCEELVVNAIRHGLGASDAADHRIDVSLDISDSADAIVIQVRDDLPLFDPTAVPIPAPATSLSSASVGGRGLELVRRATTRFRWRAEDGRNVIDAEVPLGR